MDVCRIPNTSAKMSENSVNPDPRVKRTLKLLQNALVELLKEKSFQQITVQDIAARAEVNRATFYAHFTDKYELLNYHVRDTFRTMLNKRLPPTPTLNQTHLRLLTLSVCEYLAQFLGHCKPMPPADDHAMMVLQIQRQIRETIEDWMTQTPHAIDKSHSEILMTMMSWSIFGAAMEWTRETRQRSPEQIADQVAAALAVSLPVVQVG